MSRYDISRAKLFYSSFLPELGYVLHEENKNKNSSYFTRLENQLHFEINESKELETSCP